MGGTNGQENHLARRDLFWSDYIKGLKRGLLQSILVLLQRTVGQGVKPPSLPVHTSFRGRSVKGANRCLLASLYTSFSAGAVSQEVKQRCPSILVYQF